VSFTMQKLKLDRPMMVEDIEALEPRHERT
jgi:hypothetical protein